jgi:hypothetical protein
MLQPFFFSLLIAVAGCEPAPPKPPGPRAHIDNTPDRSAIYARYVPARTSIIPLTEFVSVGNDDQASKIKVYVSLLDSFDSQIKTPGVFRFELYEHVPRSAEPKGKRITIWPNIDLTDPIDNNRYWRDHFRAYEFDLDFEPKQNHCYILEVTCICPNGKRLSNDRALKYTK